MLKKFLYSILVFGVFGIPSASAAPTSGKLCVQTMNLFGAVYAPFVKRRTKAWSDSLYRKESCDVYQLQEVWWSWHFKQLDESFEHYSKDFRSVHADKLRKDRIKVGLATFTRFGVMNKRSFLFDADGDSRWDQVRQKIGVKKGWTWISRPRRGFDPPMELINIHLHPASTAIRLAQLTEIFRTLELEIVKGKLWVFSGDFNFEPDSIEAKFFKAWTMSKDAWVEFRGSNENRDCTYCSENKFVPPGQLDRAIDQIWIKSGYLYKWNVQSAKVNFNEELYSDHYGLRVDLEWKIRRRVRQIDEWLRKFWEKWLPTPVDRSRLRETHKLFDQVRMILESSPYAEAAERTRTWLSILDGKDFKHPLYRHFGRSLD